MRREYLSQQSYDLVKGRVELMVSEVLSNPGVLKF